METMVEYDGKPHMFKGTFKEEGTKIEFTLPDPEDCQPLALVHCHNFFIKYLLLLYSSNAALV